MKNSMAGVNLRIINEVKMFLDDIKSNPERRIEYVSSDQDFTRRRVLCFQNLVLLLIYNLKRSLNVELMSYFDHFPSPVFCSKQAFSKQRRKLKAHFFHAWNQHLTSCFYREAGQDAKSWKGFRVLAIDGSSVILPDTDELRNIYGYTTNQTKNGVPVARICALFDVLNSLVIKGLLHPYNVSEENVVLDVLKGEDLTDSVLLFDRGYMSYWLIYQLLEKRTHFVIRAASNAGKQVTNFLLSDEVDRTIDVAPPYSSLKRLHAAGIGIDKDSLIKVRLVKVILPTGEIEILVTNLYDSVVYPIECLKEFYHLRWNIETFFGYLKDELQQGQFSGINPICIEQDFAANLFFFNLQSIIEKQCDSEINAITKGRKYKYKVNKNISWASLKHRIIKLFTQRNPVDVLKELEIFFCRYLEPIRPGRKYPRKQKRKPNSKHYTLTNYKRAT